MGKGIGYALEDHIGHEKSEVYLCSVIQCRNMGESVIDLICILFSDFTSSIYALISSH